MNLPHEIALMLACARVDVEHDTQETIQTLCKSGVDWDEFIKQCIRHKVLPLVHHNLSRIGSVMPQEVQSQLEETYIFENSLHNHALVEELFPVLDLLKKNRIMAVPFTRLAVVCALWYKGH